MPLYMYLCMSRLEDARLYKVRIYMQYTVSFTYIHSMPCIHMFSPYIGTSSTVSTCTCSYAYTVAMHM